MLDQVRPALLPTAEVRKRSDGTEGIYDAVSGMSFETAPDQANLVTLFDGKRSLLEISAEYLNRHGFVPFAALDDLMRGLADSDLLHDPPDSLQRVGMMDRSSFIEVLQPRSLLRFKSFFPTPLRALELLFWPALAVWVTLTYPHRALSPIDVGLFYLGAVLGLTLRDRCKAAVCALFGFAPRRTQLVSALGVLHLVPDHAMAVLMDRRPRILAHLGALFGAGCAVALAAPWPGVWAGALIVLLIDLCPMVHSSMSSLLSTLSGQLNLRDHVRAYVGLPMIKKILSFKLPRGDRAIFFSAMLSMVWVGAFLFVVLGEGLSTAVELIHVGVRLSGWETAVAYVGAVALFAACPLPLLVLVSQLIESMFSMLWPPDIGGKRSRGVADLSVFRSIPLFSKLSDDDLAGIASHSREVTYDAGQPIVEQGTAGNTFYSVRRGVVVVERGDTPEHARVVARLGIGDCFGETAMLKDGVRTATVRALTQTTLIELASEAFDKVVATVGGVDFASVLRAASAIGKSRLFRELPAERLSSLATKFVPRSVPAATDVVKFGDPGDEFFLIAKGQVDVLSADGKKLVSLADGEVFGEIALLRNVPRTATVRTTVDTLLLVLSREVFLSALHADLSLSERVEAIAASRSGNHPAHVPAPPEPAQAEAK
ncbi:MAG: cyclic nucleotide-binding domain-containing protein [Myxococcaceae bacterium]|nr:cyclic nucleotide-binding domain-containing protein [Myxococcaceae bacterium]